MTLNSSTSRGTGCTGEETGAYLLTVPDVYQAQKCAVTLGTSKNQ